MRYTIPNPDDYIRITNKYDVNVGQIGHVLYVDEDSSGIPRVQITLNPFGGGLKKRRALPAYANHIEILDPLEVLAETGR